MSDFFTKSISEGIFFVATRNVISYHNDSNIDKYSQKLNHLRYINGNNVYGSQMISDLSTEDYRFDNEARGKLTSCTRTFLSLQKDAKLIR